MINQMIISLTTLINWRTCERGTKRVRDRQQLKQLSHRLQCLIFIQKHVIDDHSKQHWEHTIKRAKHETKRNQACGVCSQRAKRGRRALHEECDLAQSDPTDSSGSQDFTDDDPTNKRTDRYEERQSVAVRPGHALEYCIVHLCERENIRRSVITRRSCPLSAHCLTQALVRWENISCTWYG